MSRTKSYSVTKLSLATVILLLLSVFSYVNIYKMKETAKWVNHTNLVKLELQKYLSDFATAASNHSGYLYTGEPDFLDGYHKGLDSVAARMRNIEKLTQDSPLQRKNAAVLKRYGERRIAYFESQLKTPRRATVEASWKQSADYYKKIRLQTETMTREEDRNLAERTASFKQQETLLPVFVILLVSGSLLVLSIGIFLLTKEVSISRRLKTELQMKSDELQKSAMELEMVSINRNLLKEVAEKFSDYQIYNEFFQLLAQYISDVAKIDSVFIGKLMHDEEGTSHIRTIAVWAQGQKVENFAFELKGSPSERVINDGIFACQEHCQHHFPESKVLKMFSAESYMGIPLRESDGEAIGLISVMCNDRMQHPDTVLSILKLAAKRAEMELQRLEQEEKLSLQNISLEEKNVSLSRMNKELEAFAYISSHDLQEPLRKIQIFISRILDKEFDSLSQNGKSYMVKTQEAAHRLQKLVQDLLAYSRLKSSATPSEPANLSLMVDQLREELDEELQGLDAQLIVSGEETVTVIESQFNQLLNNLIYNSLKFCSRERKPYITIQNERVRGREIPNQEAPADKIYNKITVTDNGIGFDPQYKERVFELFQRVHEEKEYKGTGIGLSIVKKIVDNHNGFIEADSELDKGTIFTIYLPA